jgi:proline iminopeptidase
MTGMPMFRAPDGTELAYRASGQGSPLVCVPGGPMRDSAYLGDLGGLSARRQLIIADLRGTGRSAIPADPASYRCDRIADDVGALQEHLGVDSIDLLGHSAGANIAVQYAIRHPGRIRRLALITPSARSVGLNPDTAPRRGSMQLRESEPWFADAIAAFDRIEAGANTDENWNAMGPFYYGRWDDAARAHWAAGETQVNEAAAEVFGSEGAFDPEGTRAALARLALPVLVLAGSVDPQWPPAVLAEFVTAFPAGEYVELPGASHFPWLDDAGQFAAAVTAFLDK